METMDLLRARRSSPWSRVKLLDDDKMSYSVEGKPSLDIGRMTLEYCLTSPVIDREGDLILPDAPDWADHKRNPLTLFNHKLDQPFGKSEDPAGRYTVERRGDRWYGKSYLFQNDPFAEEVYRLAEKGALNGASIGFLPAKPPFGASTVKHMNGYDYTVIERCKVFEWSAVYIPMNQDALLVAAEVVRKGLGNKPLSERAMAMFSPYVPEPTAWSNGWTPETKAAGWVTMGAKAGEDGKKNGGTPVYIDDNGEIEKGPSKLIGKKPSELKDSKKESDKKDSSKEDEKTESKKDSKVDYGFPEPTKRDSFPNINPGNKKRISKLVGIQLEKINELRDADGLPPVSEKDLVLKIHNIDDIKPSQSGEDYVNESSKELAKHIGRLGGSERDDDYAPVWIDEDMNILDGNHRHASRKISGIGTIPTVMIKSGNKSFAPTTRHNTFAHKFSGIIKMYDEKSEIEQPVDPVAANVEGDAPTTPLGAQFIAGVHEIAMTAAKFYTDNVSQLEPELVGEFTKLEKIIMGAVASMAQMFNSRYEDLPPLDGADWIDPDGDGDIDVTDDPELNPDAEEDKAMAEEAIGEDVKDGEDVTEDGPDATEDKVDATADDEVEEDEDKPKFGKGFIESTKSRLKVLLDNWTAKQKALKEAAKKIEHPDAIVAVKAASQFLRTIAGDPREDKAMRGRAKKLRADLVATLPKVKAKATVVIPVAPDAVDIDIEKIANHFKATTKALEIDSAAIQEKLAKLLQLTGK
jgi:phage head maturation protease